MSHARNDAQIIEQKKRDERRRRAIGFLWREEIGKDISILLGIPHQHNMHFSGD